MNIDELTIGQARELVRDLGIGASALTAGRLAPQPNTDLEIGKSYFIRTVTMCYTGALLAVNANEFVLGDAAWIADTGRFAAALATGEVNEVEPYPDDVRVRISRGAVLDVSDWRHPLPRKVK